MSVLVDVSTFVIGCLIIGAGGFACGVVVAWRWIKK